MSLLDAECLTTALSFDERTALTEYLKDTYSHGPLCYGSKIDGQPVVTIDKPMAVMEEREKSLTRIRVMGSARPLYVDELQAVVGAFQCGLKAADTENNNA